MHRNPWNLAAVVAGVLALLAGGPWLVRELASLPGGTALSARAGQKVVTLEIGGMTCGACAASVRSSIEQVPGVTAVEVRFPARRAYVVCDPGVPDTTLTGAVSRAGPGFLAAVARR